MSIVKDRGRLNAHCRECLTEDRIHCSTLGTKSYDLTAQIIQSLDSGISQCVDGQIGRIQRSQSTDLVHRTAGPFCFACYSLSDGRSQSDTKLCLTILDHGQIGSRSTGLLRCDYKIIRQCIV